MNFKKRNPVETFETKTPLKDISNRRPCGSQTENRKRWNEVVATTMSSRSSKFFNQNIKEKTKSPSRNHKPPKANNNTLKRGKFTSTPTKRSLSPNEYLNEAKDLEVKSTVNIQVKRAAKIPGNFQMPKEIINLYSKLPIESSKVSNKTGVKTTNEILVSHHKEKYCSNSCKNFLTSVCDAGNEQEKNPYYARNINVSEAKLKYPREDIVKVFNASVTNQFWGGNYCCSNYEAQSRYNSPCCSWSPRGRACCACCHHDHCPNKLYRNSLSYTSNKSNRSSKSVSPVNNRDVQSQTVHLSNALFKEFYDPNIFKNNLVKVNENSQSRFDMNMDENRLHNKHTGSIDEKTIATAFEKYDYPAVQKNITHRKNEAHMDKPIHKYAHKQDKNINLILKPIQSKQQTSFRNKNSSIQKSHTKMQEVDPNLLESVKKDFEIQLEKRKEELRNAWKKFPNQPVACSNPKNDTFFTCKLLSPGQPHCLPEKPKNDFDCKKTNEKLKGQTTETFNDHIEKMKTYSAKNNLNTPKSEIRDASNRRDKRLSRADPFDNKHIVNEDETKVINTSKTQVTGNKVVFDRQGDFRSDTSDFYHNSSEKELPSSNKSFKGNSTFSHNAIYLSEKSTGTTNFNFSCHPNQISQLDITKEQSKEGKYLSEISMKCSSRGVRSNEHQKDTSETSGEKIKRKKLDDCSIDERSKQKRNKERCSTQTTKIESNWITAPLVEFSDEDFDQQIKYSCSERNQICPSFETNSKELSSKLQLTSLNVHGMAHSLMSIRKECGSAQAFKIIMDQCGGSIECLNSFVRDLSGQIDNMKSTICLLNSDAPKRDSRASINDPLSEECANKSTSAHCHCCKQLTQKCCQTAPVTGDVNKRSSKLRCLYSRNSPERDCVGVHYLAKKTGHPFKQKKQPDEAELNKEQCDAIIKKLVESKFQSKVEATCTSLKILNKTFNELHRSTAGKTDPSLLLEWLEKISILSTALTQLNDRLQEVF